MVMNTILLLNKFKGWYIHDYYTPKSKFRFSRKNCGETMYANSYFSMLKISPFSNKFK